MKVLRYNFPILQCVHYQYIPIKQLLDILNARNAGSNAFRNSYRDEYTF